MLKFGICPGYLAYIKIKHDDRVDDLAKQAGAKRHLYADGTDITIYTFLTMELRNQFEDLIVKEGYSLSFPVKH